MIEVLRGIFNVMPRGMLAVVAARSRGQPVGLGVVERIRTFGWGSDPLAPGAHPVPADRAIGGPLATHLRGRELGVWALGPRSLRYIEDIVAHERPRLVIEFGSGTSTAVLANALREAGANTDYPSLVSFEQDEQEAGRTRALLAEAGLGDIATVVFAPLRRQTIERVPTICYSLPDDAHDIFGDRLAEFVVVDGPSAEPGARFGTLPLIQRFVDSTATFVLDDALRDGELEIARRWGSLPYVTISGIRIIEHGLLIGTIARKAPQGKG